MNSKNGKKRIAVKYAVVRFLVAMFAFQQSMLMSVVASDISGVTGNNGVYNIDPAKASNGIGIRHYDNFNLTEGDIANLIMHYNGSDLSTFLNLVKNGVNINGLLNTVDKDGNFSAGRAVFITPGGMIIGSSGVINVGSFEAYTNGNTYNNLTNKFNNDQDITLAEIQQVDPKYANGNITVNGKIISRGDVTMIGKNVAVGKDGHIVANANVGNTLDTNQLFKALVNTDGVLTNDQQAFVTNKNGQLVIHAQGGVNIEGNVANYANGNNAATIIDNSLNDTDAKGFILASGANITTAGGNLTLMNNMGDMNIAGNVRNNNGNITIGNTGRAMDNAGNLLNQTSSDSKLILSGNVYNNGGQTLVYNTGNNGMLLSGSVNTTNGNTIVRNGFVNNEKPYNVSGMNITGTVKTTNGNTEVTNFVTGVDGMNIAGKVITNNGDANITNYGKGGMNIKDNAEIITTGNANFTNHETGEAGMNISNNAKIHTSKDAIFTNNGKNGLNVSESADIKTNGNSTFTNKGEKGLNIKDNANITTDGDLTMENYGKEGLNIVNNAVITTKGNANFTNHETGEAGMNISNNAKIHTSKDAIFTNNGKNGLNVSESADIKTNGNSTFTNKGEKGLNIKDNANITTDGDLTMENYGKEGLNIVNNAVITTKGNANFTNYETGEAGMNISNNAKIYTSKDAIFTNNGKGGMNITGNTNITTNGKSTFTNYGEKGLNVKDTARITSDGYLLLDNYGKDGMLIAPGANVLGHNDALLRNDSVGGIKIQGHVTTDKGTTNIESKKGDIVLGHDNTNNNVTAKKDINIKAYDANILNYAHDSGIVKLHSYDGAKTFLVADGDLNMYAENGRIGDLVEGVCLSGNCTGIGATGVRDFNKSINANIKGKVNAQTVDKAAKQNEYVINYAAIDSDMNIDQIKADGRVILTIDADSQDKSVKNADGTYKYNMKNVSSDPNKANVEGWGISLISSGNIGEKDNKLTFNQTRPGTLRTAANDGLTSGNANATDGYGMDVLANGDINMKGLDDQYTVNNVCSMVSREGNIDVEFSGNTYIEEVTAKKDIKLVTRGKTMEINHLGTVPTLGDNGQVGDAVYDTYLGTGNRVKDDANTGDDDGLGYDSATPNNAIVKALDINKNISPLTEGPVDKNGDGDNTYPAYADSTVVVRNAMLEVEGPNANGNLDITADNVYANGIVAHFNKDGFTKAADDRTNPVIGGNTPTGRAVRPDDVTDIGRNDHERNYYYPEGDGDLPDNGKPNDYKPRNNPDGVDPNNGVVDATPLILPIKPNIIPDDKPNVKPNPKPDEEKDKVEGLWKKQDSNAVQAIDKRQYMRFNVSDNKNAVAMERNNNGIDGLVDVSRGGIAVKHNGTLKPGDVIPVHLTYGDLDIKADVKVVSATTSRAGAEFVNLDKATANQLLFLSILLEDANNIAFNK